MAQKIYGMGNPLLDISADVDAAYLEKYGLQPANAILAEDKHKPIYAELAAMPGVQYIPGGATLNSIRCANWVLRSKHPNSCTYVGCVGSDKFGETLISKAEGEGVAMPVMKVTDEPTGTCAVCIVGKERSLCANLAAANKFDVSHLQKPEVQKALNEASIFYSSGFHITVSIPALVAVGKAAAADNNKVVDSSKQEDHQTKKQKPNTSTIPAKDKRFCLNLAAPFVCEFFKAGMLEVMPYVDIVFGNDDEARAFAKANELGTEDLGKIAEYIRGMTKENKDKERIVVFTQGSKETLLATKDGNTEIPVAPIPSEKILDSNGAGDAFVGGFLAMLAAGKPLNECVLCGHYVAGTIIQHSGCSYPEAPEQFLL